MNIGDIYGTLRAEGSQFITDAQKAGDQAGQKAGDSFSAKFSTAMRSAVGAGLGAAFGIMIQQGRELDAATQKLAADTGLSGQALADQGKAIDNMYKTSLASMDQVEGTLAQVISGFGLQGQAADDLTASIIKYQEATGQGADATAALKKITDAFNLSASDEGHIMDLLVASHQQYGTSVTADQEALAAMAPALDAMGMGLSDGVDLLNLFAKAGIDASKAPMALQKAIKALKPGQNLNDLIAQISSIQDPTERAQKAMVIFGTRGGAQLAQALQPGITSLDQFATSFADTNDASKKAAQAVEDDWVNRATIIAHQIGGTLAEVGQNFGPLLLLGMIGGPKIGAAVGAMLGFFTSQGAAAGGAVVAGEAVAVEAGGPEIAAAVAAQEGEVVAAGGGLGAALGAAIGAAAAAALPLAILAGGLTIDAILANLSIAALGRGAPQAAGDRKSPINGQTYGPDPTLPQAGGQYSSAWIVQELHDSRAPIAAAADDAMSGIPDAAQTAATDAATDVADGIIKMESTIKASRAGISSAWSDALGGATAAQDIQYAKWQNQQEQAALRAEMANKAKWHAMSLQDQTAAEERLRSLKAEYVKLLAEDANYGTQSEKIAKTAGLLSSQAMTDGLQSSDPEVSAMWVAVYADTEMQLWKLQGLFGTAGHDASAAFIAAIKAQSPGLARWFDTGTLPGAGGAAPQPGQGGTTGTSSPTGPYNPGSGGWAPIFDSGGIVGGAPGSHQWVMATAGEQFTMPGQRGYGGQRFDFKGAVLNFGSDVSPAAARRFLNSMDELANGLQKEASRFASYTGSRP